MRARFQMRQKSVRRAVGIKNRSTDGGHADLLLDLDVYAVITNFDTDMGDFMK